MFTDASVPKYNFNMSDNQGNSTLNEKDSNTVKTLISSEELDNGTIKNFYQLEQERGDGSKRIVFKTEVVENKDAVNNGGISASFAENNQRVTTLNEYMDEALKTAIYPKDLAISYLCLGLTSEAGEVAGKYKKVIRDNFAIMTDEHRHNIMSEASDVLWYVACLAKELGYSLEDVANYNVDKLRKRQQNNTLSGSGDNR